MVEEKLIAFPLPWFRPARRGHGTHEPIFSRVIWYLLRLLRKSV
jgi:hypothetical protein